MEAGTGAVPVTKTPDSFTLALATLNTRGLPVLRSALAHRYAAIAAGFEQSGADVVLCQEVFTYYHLAQLSRRLRSYEACYRRSVAGPAGGLVTFARMPAHATSYRRFPLPRTAGLPLTRRVRALLKGALVTVFRQPGPVAVINAHALANRDGDWSQGNRFHRAQAGQLARLSQVIADQQAPVVIAGDFNMPAEAQFGAFLAASGLTDLFGGDCPPTFRAEFLPPGQTALCVDFILGSASVQVANHGVMFAGDMDASAGSGPVSDHVGLFATVTVARSTAAG